MPSILEQYRISDFLEWNEEKRLVLNPDFQRGDVWNPTAKTFLIDTILRKLPIPKVYLRTSVDINTKKSIREVVDGQQRLRAILDFANGKFALSKRASEFSGKKYDNLSDEDQESFLSYPIAVDQLVNASIDDVLEVFARLNSYTVTLNAPEKRHGRFQGEFKWAVRGASRKWAALWERYNILSTRERVRMMDDSLTAEMLGILLEGVKDGGQPKIDLLYNKYDGTFDVSALVKLDSVLNFLQSQIVPFLQDTALLNPPHFLMLFAAAAHVLVGIPEGELTPAQFPARLKIADMEKARENLTVLASVISSPGEPPPPNADFWKASKSSTQRIASRRVRFPMYFHALTT